MQQQSTLPCTTDRPRQSGGRSSPVELLGQLLSLQHQLARLADSPSVNASRRLTAEVAAVLEPVWTVLAVADPQGGIGYLRRIGDSNTSAEAAALNTAVAREVVQTYRGLNLVAPAMRDVWCALARPAAALIDSVRSPGPNMREAKPNNEPVVGTLGATLRPVLPSRLLGTWDDDMEVVPALRRVLRRWCELARRATGEQREVARLTLAAALLARGAALDGDVATVEWFVERWLGLRSTTSRVDGATAALLEDGWTYRSVDHEFSAVRDTVTDLRIEAAYQHRLHRPIWETDLCGAPVALLSEPAASAQPNGPLLADSLVTEDTVHEIVTQGLLKEQLQHVLNILSTEEARLVEMHFIEGRTWAEIRRTYGASRNSFDKVRNDLMGKLRHPSRSTALRDYLY